MNAHPLLMPREIGHLLTMIGSAAAALRAAARSPFVASASSPRASSSLHHPVALDTRWASGLLLGVRRLGDAIAEDDPRRIVDACDCLIEDVEQAIGAVDYGHDDRLTGSESGPTTGRFHAELQQGLTALWRLRLKASAAARCKVGRASSTVATSPAPHPQLHESSPWEVEVRIAGERVLTLTHGHFSELANGAEFEGVIRDCACRLLVAFGAASDAQLERVRERVRSTAHPSSASVLTRSRWPSPSSSSARA